MENIQRAKTKKIIISSSNNSIINILIYFLLFVIYFQLRKVIDFLFQEFSLYRKIEQTVQIFVIYSHFLHTASPLIETLH